ncbi:sulfotransferase 1B1 [Rhipicephalus sanguineus]|uniref:sulfotransferase 1B1 n=1 Tax=Rhipicephalus sanguineus TaxID=34632 RepID=UPI00189346C5|nr:sulfotransferase 1B1 [Rhipicephalus sanguineus]
MAADVFRTIQGLYLGKHFPDDAVLSTLEYKPRPGDLFLVSYPKSGSTWTLRIMYNILMDAVDSDDPLEPIIRFPCLEMQGAEAAIYAPRPAAFKTHLPFHKNPYSPEAKYVYIARNPYDTCVSFYYHTKHFPAYKFQNGTFDEFFELFIKGRVDYGDYFDNVFSWYEHRDDPNVLFLTYEELKANTRQSVLKIAAFISPEKEKRLKENTEILNRILDKTSLANMKKTINVGTQGQSWSESPMLKTIHPELLKGLRALFDFFKVPMTGDFVRKGQVGDWRNHFSQEQIQQMKEWIAEATKGSDLMKLWEDVDIP